ncbi:MAG: hypothetical protein ACE5FD_06585 [Anaerolineae bacterium]
MTKESQVKSSEKTPPTKPAAEPAGIEQGVRPSLTAAGQLLPPADLPKGLRQKQVQAVQGVAGNQTVLRALAKDVIQRQDDGGDEQPIPKLPSPKARRAKALEILKKAYGGLIKQESKVNGVDSEAALRQHYDNSMIRQGKVFRESDDSTRPWQAGDSSKHSGMSGEFPGFYDPSTGQIYIDLSKEPDQQVATLVHEMLHANTAGDFLSTLGKSIDEGMTENLTKKAFAKSGYSAPSGFFEGEVAMVGRLSGMFGENTMMYAYFGGTAVLRSMMDAVMDQPMFDRFAREMRRNNTAWLNLFLEQYEQALQGSEIDKKIAAISALLDWWVSDEDLDQIENIWRGVAPDEKPHIRAAINPRITSLSDHGQRARLRGILGS